MSGFTMPQGTMLPPEFLAVLREISTLSELKVLIALLAVSSDVGIDARGLTFDDILHATSLARASTDKGLKLALQRGTIVKSGSKYEPNWNGVSKGELHVHDMHVLKHEHNSSLETCMQEHASSDFEKILVSEFGLAVRVALDLVRRYPREHLFTHINQARYARAKGMIKSNLQGWLVASIRDNWGPPKGFSWVTVLEAQGWTTERMYEAHAEGSLQIPEIENSIGYSIWQQQLEELTCPECGSNEVSEVVSSLREGDDTGPCLWLCTACHNTWEEVGDA
jgi:DNA-directed RNA polymerase subunit M/transcription elongation factor TFIIS